MQLQEIIQRDDSVFPSDILKNQITTRILTLMPSRHRTLHPHRGPPCRLSTALAHSLTPANHGSTSFAHVSSVKSMQSRGRCLSGLTFFTQHNSPGIHPGGVDQAFVSFPRRVVPGVGTCDHSLTGHLSRFWIFTMTITHIFADFTV